MGAVSRIRNPVGQVSLSALEDQWQRDATAAAIAGARGVVQMDGPIPPGTPIGRLSDTEWGWIVAAILLPGSACGPDKPPQNSSTSSRQSE